MDTCARWTGIEVKALREAARSTQEQFAQAAGVSVDAVKKWERRGGSIGLRGPYAARMDRELKRAAPDVQQRFWSLASTTPTDAAHTINGHSLLDQHEFKALLQRRYVDPELAQDLAGLLADTRRLEDDIGSKRVLPLAVRHGRITAALAVEARSSTRSQMANVAAGWQQFLGWLYASLGNHTTSVQHYRAALELATESGDPDMISTALSMRGHVAWMAGQVGPMIGLSQAAQRNASRVSPTVLAMATQQEARGLAIEGQYDAMEAKLDTAAGLMMRNDPNRPDAQYFYSESFLQMQRGLAYRLAGQWSKAVAALDGGMAGFDPGVLTAEWATWYIAESACALAGVGEPEAACRRASQALRVGIATPGSRLTEFIRVVHQDLSSSWPRNDAVLELREELRGTGSTQPTCEAPLGGRALRPR